MKSIPQQVSKSVRERNPHLYPEYTSKDHNFDRFVKEFDKHHPQPPKRIRQSTKPLMNKLEGEWFDHLVSTYPSCSFCPQTTKFKLGNGIWYKPDVFSMCFQGLVTCWEVKGPFAHRGGFENLKVAVSKYPEMKWILVWKQDGKWQEQVVLP